MYLEFGNYEHIKLAKEKSLRIHWNSPKKPMSPREAEETIRLLRKAFGGKEIK